MKRKDGKRGENKLNAALQQGGPAGGDTSYDVSSHFIHRRIVNKTILTWGRDRVPN
jgi:hypothetical protein